MIGYLFPWHITWALDPVYGTRVEADEDNCRGCEGKGDGIRVKCANAQFIKVPIQSGEIYIGYCTLTLKELKT